MTETSTAPASIKPGIVTLILPAAAEYVSVARLAILGIANRLPFAYDEVEDIRLAVGEACSHAVERSHESGGADSGTITIVSAVTESGLTIDVSDNAPVLSDATATDHDDDIDRQGLGALLMEILVDEVEVTADATGTRVRLVKNAPTHGK